VADLLAARLQQRFPNLAVVGTRCPPFRALTGAEQESAAAAIIASGATSSGPGSARPSRSVGWSTWRVGAAFDFHAGLKQQSPGWIHRSGLEWAFRLATERRRLWRRYLVNNTRFVALLITEQLRGGLRRSRSRRQAPSRTTT
jgi:N-acetylglucosaminyldiphosphoundecaprenol N-acetyl-beta-D-mannosaminyltransferase